MKLIITSEMRCGSRWLHYLLADLYAMKVSPEVDKGIMDERLSSIRKYMNNNRIAKFHHAVQEDVFRVVTPIDYFLIGVVRNPRDRGVSRAFHVRYNRKGKATWCDSDQEAVNRTLTSQAFFTSNARQLILMEDGCSTRNHIKNKPYIWTSYEWMLDDIVREVTAITRFIGLDIPGKKIAQVCFEHTFESKTGRLKGMEERSNRWRRKGVMCDWLNWFDRNLLLGTAAPQRAYWEKLLRNKERNND